LILLYVKSIIGRSSRGVKGAVERRSQRLCRRGLYGFNARKLGRGPR
jgi:hypothetical protein